MRSWEAVIPAEDRELYELAGREPIGWGERPALLVIDVTYEFVGHRSEPVRQSMQAWPKSCGERGWAAIPSIAALLRRARAARLPIAYTTGTLDETAWLRRRKGPQRPSPPAGFLHAPTDIVEEITPGEGDLIVHKPAASAFFATALVPYLLQRQVDSLIVTGGTTSGCVRATVVDANAYGYRVAVVEEAVFDRWQISHQVSLFDMHAKYADVVPVDGVLRRLEASDFGARPRR